MTMVLRLRQWKGKEWKGEESFRQRGGHVCRTGPRIHQAQLGKKKIARVLVVSDDSDLKEERNVLWEATKGLSIGW